ncbi:hypothetical protein EZS27_030467 [termite gut metagenome]|uniref:Uncharacterized protein n=1 Tax=termite gut metagenome TaxID=433724 RepID=A0A5J4QEN9_9ZZZZ
MYSTVEQIRILLGSRIQDFANKEIGLINESDIFGACIRRNLDKTQLERMKDHVESDFNKYKIEIIREPQLKNIIAEAKKSSRYKSLIEKRAGNKNSALNDAVAWFYVNNRRGGKITEFSDVKCWFLHNSYKTDYESNLGVKIHDRNTISANELLTLLWLTNPSQNNVDSNLVAKGGLATYIAKYRSVKMPTNEVIVRINEKVKTALKYGKVEQKDVYAIGIRMSEGHFTNNEIEELIKLPDEEFISKTKELSKQDEEMKMLLNSREKEISDIKSIVQTLSENNESLKKENAQIKYDFAMQDYNKRKEDDIKQRISVIRKKSNKYSAIYILFVIFIIILWFVNYMYIQYLNAITTTIISFSLMFIPLVIIRFIEHKFILQCLKHTFSKKYRIKTQRQYEREYEKSHEKPINANYGN